MINRNFLLLFIAAFIIKSIPDYLILYETTRRYNKRHLMKWFIPSQIVYPFYVLTVVIYSLFATIAGSRKGVQGAGVQGAGSAGFSCPFPERNLILISLISSSSNSFPSSLIAASSESDSASSLKYE